MGNLSVEQRQGILDHYGGLVRTYFAAHELIELTVPFRWQRRLEDVEFYAYLRLSTLIAHGQRLPAILRRIALAPSVANIDELVEVRGRLPGRLDVPTYVRRRGRVVQPRSFPVHRSHANYALPENVMAASAVSALMSELQSVLTALPLRGTSEEREIGRMLDVLEQAARVPPIGTLSGTSIPHLWSAEVDQLVVDAAERWNTRRISNLAYADLFRWCNNYRRRGLGEGALSPAVAYSESFDDKLFEIFCVALVRAGLTRIGFEEVEVHPLHERRTRPVVVARHPDTGLRMALHFQKGESVAWTKEAPREWPAISGVPDIGLVPSSDQHPVMLVDAKNRFRGGDLDDSIADELFKMLGYFNDFSLRVRIGKRGPCGALLFLGRTAGGQIETFTARTSGVLLAAAVDPCDPRAEARTAEVLMALLQCSGLQASETALDRHVKALKVNYPALAAADVDEANIGAVLDRLHELIASTYGQMDEPIREALRDLELHVLGTVWERVPSDIRQLLATAEVFYKEHYLAVGIDFAPVVVELARACEILVARWLMEPCRDWAIRNGRRPPSGLNMLGQVRNMLEGARDFFAASASGTGDALTLKEYVVSRKLESYAFGDLITDLGFVNNLRRKAAHKDMISGVDATGFRERILGIGSATPVLPRLIVMLG